MADDPSVRGKHHPEVVVLVLVTLCPQYYRVHRRLRVVLQKPCRTFVCAVFYKLFRPCIEPSWSVFHRLGWSFVPEKNMLVEKMYRSHGVTVTCHA